MNANRDKRKAPLIALVAGAAPTIAFLLEILLSRVFHRRALPEHLLMLPVAFFALPFGVASVVYAAWRAALLRDGRLGGAVVAATFFHVGGGWLILLAASSI